jgi:HSP20 family protein
MNLTETTCCNATETVSKSNEAKSIRPAVSSRNEESGVRLDIALPGVRKEALKLKFHEGVLALEASRSDVPSVRYVLSVKLAERLDGSRISAALEDGVLKVFAPLREEAKPREVVIN